jgi:dolichol-phosphate mannosyltransferase
MRVLVVLPTYNEAANIERVLGLVRAALPEADVLVVDDGSPDGTAAIARAVGARVGHVEVLERERKAGLGSAYRAGFRVGLDRGYGAFVEMDSDLSHDPAALPSLIAPLEDGYGLVVGSRYVEGGSIPNWSWYRHLLSRGGNLYAAWMLGFDVADSTSGFRAYRAAALKAIDLESVRSDGYGFQIEMVDRVLRAGFRVTEVPIRFVDRARGSSKMSAHIVLEALALVTLWGVARRLGRFVRWGRGLLRRPALARPAAAARRRIGARREHWVARGPG